MSRVERIEAVLKAAFVGESTDLSGYSEAEQEEILSEAHAGARRTVRNHALTYAAIVVGYLLFQAVSAAERRWCGLVVEAETACPSYDAREWAYPADMDVRFGQRTADGRCFSPYDGEAYPTCKELDIEHLRARHSAAKGGGCGWPEALKRAYASDPLNITVAPAGINRHAKSDRDPDSWMPSVGKGWFAWRYVAVSRRYGLSITPATRDALAEVVGRRCP